MLRALLVITIRKREEDDDMYDYTLHGDDEAGCLFKCNLINVACIYNISSLYDKIGDEHSWFLKRKSLLMMSMIGPGIC